MVECRTPEREVRGSRPTAAVLCPWARHFTPRKYWLITQEAMAPSLYDWKIVDWDVKPQHNQPTFLLWKQLTQIVGQTWLNLVTLTCGSWSEGQHDLYFTVQWFCLISWRLFNVCTSYFGIMNQYDPTFDLKLNVGHWPIFHGPSDFALYLEDYLMCEHHYLGLWISMTWYLTSK